MFLQRLLHTLDSLFSTLKRHMVQLHFFLLYGYFCKSMCRKIALSLVLKTGLMYFGKL
jgi:hypothetical protein